MKGAVTYLLQFMQRTRPPTFNHSLRVEQYASQLAAEISNDPNFLSSIRVAALMHDVGKLRISKRILLKPEKLTPIEWALIRNHPAIGYDLLRSHQSLDHVAEITLQHHEWWNGNGYPKKLKERQVKLEARIICIADAIEAMTGERVYKPAITINDALTEIINNAGKQFDPELVEIIVARGLFIGEKSIGYSPAKKFNKHC